MWKKSRKNGTALIRKRETRFLSLMLSPRNRVSATIYASSRDCLKKPGFGLPEIQETGFLRSFTRKNWLKASPFEGEIKIRLFITPILFLLGRGRSQTVTGQLSQVNC